jgi:hypothetical protein
VGPRGELRGRTGLEPPDDLARVLLVDDVVAQTGKARIVPLTDRVVEAIRSLPTPLGKDHVFVNPDTGNPWNDPYKLDWCPPARAGWRSSPDRGRRDEVAGARSCACPCRST